MKRVNCEKSIESFFTPFLFSFSSIMSLSCEKISRVRRLECGAVYEYNHHVRTGKRKRRGLLAKEKKKKKGWEGCKRGGKKKRGFSVRGLRYVFSLRKRPLRVEAHYFNMPLVFNFIHVDEAYPCATTSRRPLSHSHPNVYTLSPSESLNEYPLRAKGRMKNEIGYDFIIHCINFATIYVYTVFYPLLVKVLV